MQKKKKENCCKKFLNFLFCKKKEKNKKEFNSTFSEIDEEKKDETNATHITIITVDTPNQSTDSNPKQSF